MSLKQCRFTNSMGLLFGCRLETQSSVECASKRTRGVARRFGAAPRRSETRSAFAAMAYTRNLPGWLETRLAQTTSDYLSIAHGLYFTHLTSARRRGGGEQEARRRALPRPLPGRREGGRPGSGLQGKILHARSHRTENPFERAAEHPWDHSRTTIQRPLPL